MRNTCSYSFTAVLSYVVFTLSCLLYMKTKDNQYGYCLPVCQLHRVSHSANDYSFPAQFPRPGNMQQTTVTAARLIVVLLPDYADYCVTTTILVHNPMVISHGIPQEWLSDISNLTSDALIRCFDIIVDCFVSNNIVLRLHNQWQYWAVFNT